MNPEWYVDALPGYKAVAIRLNHGANLNVIS